MNPNVEETSQEPEFLSFIQQIEHFYYIKIKLVEEIKKILDESEDVDASMANWNEWVTSELLYFDKMVPAYVRHDIRCSVNIDEVNGKMSFLKDLIAQGGNFVKTYQLKTMDDVNNLKMTVENMDMKLKQLINMENKKLNPFETQNIFEAIKSGREVAVRFWLRQFPDCVNSLYENGYPPLHFAVSLNKYYIVKLLVEEGHANIFDIEKARGRSVLHLAVEANSLSLLRYFNMLEVSLSMYDYHHETALHYATKKKSLPLIAFLIDQKCPDTFNMDNKRAVHFADVSQKGLFTGEYALNDN